MAAPAPVTVPLNVSGVVTFTTTPIPAQIAVVQQAVPVESTSISFASPTTAGNCVVVIIAIYDNGGSTPTVTGVTLGGSADNFVSAAGAAVGVAGLFIWVDPKCAGGQTAIVVSGTNLAFPLSIGAVFAYEVSGLLSASVVDKISTGTGTSQTTSTSGATAATTVPNEIWFGGAVNASNPITGPASPWINQAPGFNSQAPGAVAGYQVVTSTGTATYAATSGADTNWAAAVVTLKGSTTIAGAGTAKIGPISQRELWYPQVISVSASSAVNQASCKTYAGADTSQPNFVWQTANGSTGDTTANIAGPGLAAINLPGRVIRCGEYIWAVWTAGDAGAQGRLNIQGMRVMNSGGPPGWEHHRTRKLG